VLDLLALVLPAEAREGEARADLTVSVKSAVVGQQVTLTPEVVASVRAGKPTGTVESRRRPESRQGAGRQRQGAPGGGVQIARATHDPGGLSRQRRISDAHGTAAVTVAALARQTEPASGKTVIAIAGTRGRDIFQVTTRAGGRIIRILRHGRE
jgi:hypothetical protein